MKTYMILKGENNNNANVLGYYRTLTHAKEVLLDNPYMRDSDNVFILMLQGYRFGEGFHQYMLKFDGKKFRREYV